MTYPSGTPGGYPGQGPQQRPQAYPGAQSSGRPALPLAQILLLATGGLGVLNLFLGFADIGEGIGFYDVHGWVPALLFIAGLTAVFGFLPPGDTKPGPWPAVLSVGSMLPFLFTVFSIDSLAAGGVLVLIFGLLQMGAAVAAYLLESGIVKAPKPQSAASPYGGAPYGPPSGAFPQPGQQPAHGMPQPGQFGQQPSPAETSGGIPQPGQAPTGQANQPTAFAQPVQQQPTPHQQPTQYAPQQGQFFHQSSESGQAAGEQSGDQGGKSSQSGS